MKAIILFLLPMCLGAAEVVDLGVISHTSLIELHKCERRKDFARFKIEILPRNLRGWTNKVEFTTTNSFLKLDDLAAVPEGVAVMGVRSYCVDGVASPLALFKIDVQREAPNAPRATVSQILTMPTEQKIEHVLEGNRPVTPPPPMPGQTNPPAQSAMPLPGGHPTSYAQYQRRLEEAALLGRRRSQ
jgi:hypothetical protein